MTLLDALKGVANASQPLPWLVVSGQPSSAQLEAARDAGVVAVVDLRDPMEPRPFEEAATTRSLGMDYRNAPVVSGALSDQVMDRALAALRASTGTPTLLHCNSANRTGGPLLAYFMIDEGMDEAAAVDAALRSGLRSAELLEWAVDYANRHRKRMSSL